LLQRRLFFFVQSHFGNFRGRSAAYGCWADDARHGRDCGGWIGGGARATYGVLLSSDLFDGDASHTPLAVEGVNYIGDTLLFAATALLAGFGADGVMI
jgi:hypothetical protein